ncbi:MAG: hypothetical protein AB7I13_17980 [Vicinamibacterales bacterium]
MKPIPIPTTYDEPTVMWRMKRSDGLTTHAVIGTDAGAAWAMWFLNGSVVGVRKFDDLAGAYEWTERLQFQNWTVGWRLAADDDARSAGPNR